MFSSNQKQIESKTDRVTEEMEEFMQIDPEILCSLDELEAKAYKLLYIWLKRSRKTFPDYKHPWFKNKNPLKTQMFRLCYKLVRTTQGILDEEDYELYVRAQLEILKVISRTQQHPVIDANCLVGEKAWIRWKLWKKKYDSKKKISEKENPVTPKSKIVHSLQSTKEFLIKQFDGLPDFESFNQTVFDNNLYRWISFGKISPYYLVMSPYVSKAIPEIEKAANIDLSVYRSCVSEEIQKEFNNLFPNEASSEIL